MKALRPATYKEKERPNDFLTRFGVENIINLIPVAVYCCDTEGNIVYFNEKAVEAWGRRPNTGEQPEKFCGSYKIYTLDGSYLPNDQCPMAKAILEKLPALNGDIIIERPDSSWIYCKVQISSIKDENGNIAGHINTIRDVSTEKRLNRAYESTMENFRFLADFIPQLV